ncbi:MAG: hypothetical protein JSW27_07450 [Phycisphaerales bacterium]|nr:MAG: hypothetical protein JSW27_07450 [Phycisphaerales bacterium]
MKPQRKRRIDDTAPEALNMQCTLYRGMSEAEKLKLVFETYHAGKRLAITGLRIRHPEADEAEIERLWARQHLGDELFDAAYGALSRE